MRYTIYLFLIVLFSNVLAQPSRRQSITLQQTVSIASDSSLASFKAGNLYLSDYWQYRTYKAERLPGLSLGMTPVSYGNNIVKRYDSQTNTDVYKSQQNWYSHANLTLSQNMDITGGTFFIDTELGYLRNMGLKQNEQFTSVPVRIGYSQALFGYNRFRWQRKLEPLKYEKAKKDLLYNMEEISEQAASLFFDLALSQTRYSLAQQNIANNDTLYRIGQERYKIGSISQSDLLTLKLSLLNANSESGNAVLNLRKASFALSDYLRIDKETLFQPELPSTPLNITITSDEAIRLARENNPRLPEIKKMILEAQQNLDKARKENRFAASVSASVGFNQVSNTLTEAYHKPLQQDVVSVSLNVPIIDWGVRKGKVNIAQRDLNAVNITAHQAEQAFEQDVRITVDEFNFRQSQLQSANEAREIAQLAYGKAKQLFFVGKADVNSVNLAVSRQIETELNYIITLKGYWLSYYKIRKLTLYDFVKRSTISAEFDQISGF